MIQKKTDVQARNNIVIDAPVEKIYEMITDISLLPKINPGVLSAIGKMNEVGSSRHCTIDNRGKEGKMEERCIALMPNQKTVWSLEKDTIGFTKMMRDITFTFTLKSINVASTSVTNETAYTPRNLFARLMNSLMMKGMISKTQQKILLNLKSLAESNSL